MNGGDDACAAPEAVENVPVESGSVSRDRLSGLVVRRQQRRQHRQQREQGQPMRLLEVGGWFGARWPRQLFAKGEDESDVSIRYCRADMRTLT